MALPHANPATGYPGNDITTFPNGSSVNYGIEYNSKSFPYNMDTWSGKSQYLKNIGLDYIDDNLQYDAPKNVGKVDFYNKSQSEQKNNQIKTNWDTIHSYIKQDPKTEFFGFLNSFTKKSKPQQNKSTNIVMKPQYDKYIDEFYTNDYFPRMKRENPKMSDKDVAALRDKFYKTQVVWDPKQQKNSAANDKANDRVILGFGKVPRWMAVHELAHNIRQSKLGLSNITKTLSSIFKGDASNSGYSAKERQYLKSAYLDNPSWTKRSFGNTDTVDKNRELYEAGTVNTQTRYQIWRSLRKKLGRVPSLDETDKYIKSLTKEQLNHFMTNTRDQYIHSITKKVNGKDVTTNGLIPNGGYNSNRVKQTMIKVADAKSSVKNKSPYYDSGRSGNYAKYGAKLFKK